MVAVVTVLIRGSNRCGEFEITAEVLNQSRDRASSRDFCFGSG